MVKKMMALALAAALTLTFAACQGGGPAPLPSVETPVLDSGEKLPSEEEPLPQETAAVQDSGQEDPPKEEKEEAFKPPPLPKEERQQAGELLAPQVEEICRNYSTMGMSLVVFDREGPFYSQSWGWAVRETGLPAGEDTVFRVASISKAVTALLALDLAEEGKLDLHGDLR